MDLTLICWVRGDDVDDVFEVEIPGEADVGQLKKALKEKRSTTFRDVDVSDLMLYPLLVPSATGRAGELGKWRLHGKQALHNEQKLSEVFCEPGDGKWVVVINYRAHSDLDDSWRLTIFIYSNCKDLVPGLF
ncbi:hypothetical protein EDC04DRAFT_2578713 [Pisolithus marmoratus]|nr:hypothetical protein EDC04DRAFT_2578713 [Pisolithus marmoratus]